MRRMFWSAVTAIAPDAGRWRRSETSPSIGNTDEMALWWRPIFKASSILPNYPSSEVAVARMEERLSHPGLYGVVAELDGHIVGSNFLDERGPIAGLGPITVAPTVQNRTIGRHLMQAVLERVAARRCL